MHINLMPGGGGWGLRPIMAYMGTEAPPTRGTFFRLQVYERVGTGILLIEVYERGVKSVIWVCERAQSANK